MQHNILNQRANARETVSWLKQRWIFLDRDYVNIWARARRRSPRKAHNRKYYSLFFLCTLHASIPFERYLAIVVKIWFIANILVSTVDSWNCSTPRLCLCVCYARPAPFGRIDRVLPSLNFTSHRIIICLRSDITNNKIRIHIFRLWLHRTSDVYY